MSKLRRLERKANINNSLHHTREEAEAKLALAQEKYYAFKKVAKASRQTFLWGLAEAVAQKSDQTSYTAYKQLIHRENQRESGRKMRAALGKLVKGGIKRIEVPGDNDETVELLSKHAIEKACLAENERKYRQTEQTPCMTNPLHQQLGAYGETFLCRQILDGSFAHTPQIAGYTTEFFCELQQHPGCHSPQFTAISTKDFQEGWAKMRETTSSGGTDLHFGHMKACASSEFLSKFEASIAQIPFSVGYSPAHWQRGTIVMIQKKEGVDLVSKLCTLVLTSADFNHNNKILGRKTLWHAEDNNLLAKEQYGSRKNKRAIEHAIHKRLTYDIMRQSRINGALCSNDAMLCYDRILHAIASSAYQRLGVPMSPIQSMFESIQNMKHNIRTSYGDSIWTISSKGTLIPYQGVLQGNGAAPATWVILSTPLLNMMRTAGHGAYFCSPLTNQLSHYVGYAYVDDADLVEYDARDPTITIDEVMTKMQSAVD